MKPVDDGYAEEKKLFKPMEVFGLLLMLLPIFLSAWIFVWQIYSYLRWGHWTSFSIIDGLAWLKIEWANNPTDWIGLHSFLDKLHASVGLMLIVLSYFGHGKK